MDNQSLWQVDPYRAIEKIRVVCPQLAAGDATLITGERETIGQVDGPLLGMHRQTELPAIEAENNLLEVKEMEVIFLEN